MIDYLPVPPVCRPYVATIHFGAMAAGLSRGSIIAPQIWVCTSPVWWHGTSNDAATLLPPVSLVGPTSQAVAVTMKRPTRFPGCGLTMRGWAQLVGIPAHQLTDATLDCSLLWREPCDRLLQQLAAARCARDEHAAMTAFAMRLASLACQRAANPRIAAVDAWLRGAGRLDALAGVLGLSWRQTSRIVQEVHGLSPKVLFAKHRAVRAAARALHTGPGIAELWDEYADQSHCIREFRRFLGVTLRGYQVQDDAALARSTIAGDRL